MGADRHRQRRTHWEPPDSGPPASCPIWASPHRTRVRTQKSEQNDAVSLTNWDTFFAPTLFGHFDHRGARHGWFRSRALGGHLYGLHRLGFDQRECRHCLRRLGSLDPPPQSLNLQGELLVRLARRCTRG
jgi:hypothetical protein